MVAADKYAQFSICRLKHDEDKIMQIDENKLLALAGPIGDRNQFGEIIRKSIHLHRLRTGLALQTSAAASFTRVQMAEYLRRNPFQVDVLLGGFDFKGDGENEDKKTEDKTKEEKDGKPILYWLDYLASLVSVNKAAHGYGAYFVYGILDQYWKPNMSEEEGLELMKKCVAELTKRFIISQSHFLVKIVKTDGIKVVHI